MGAVGVRVGVRVAVAVMVAVGVMVAVAVVVAVAVAVVVAVGVAVGVAVAVGVDVGSSAGAAPLVARIATPSAAARQVGGMRAAIGVLLAAWGAIRIRMSRAVTHTSPYGKGFPADSRDLAP